LPLLFAITLFVSATLLFLVQPMIAKMILPLLGGTPAVWTTCMVFFQAVLLAGYSYAHFLTSRFTLRRQLLIHGILLLLPFLVLALPVGISHQAAPPDESHPNAFLALAGPDLGLALWLLGLLVVSIGVPFFVLSATAPLLQKWFTYTAHRSAEDPYFLYAASNMGSMLALLGYPALVEPFLPLKAQRFDAVQQVFAQVWFSQSWLWTLGYGVLVILMLYCVGALWRASESIPADRREEKPAHQPSPEAGSTPLTTGTRLYWVALAFVPSSLMLGVTTFITLDIAAIPLLWIIPLALYLLSFIIVFARWPLAAHTIMVVLMPLAVLLVVFMMLTDMKSRISVTIVLHLVALFLVSMVCHGELARQRPSTQYLTQFFLLISLGGVLGGVFNALIAPLVFRSVAEYRIAMACACLLLPSINPEGKVWISRWFPEKFTGAVGIVTDVVFALLVGLVANYLIWFFMSGLVPKDTWLARSGEWVDIAIDKFQKLLEYWSVSTIPSVLQIRTVLAYGIPVLICYAFVARPLRFGLAVAAFLYVGAVWTNLLEAPGLAHQERSFFGVLKVQVGWEDDPETETKVRTVKLVHGTTLHGKQIRDDRFPELQREPLTYYHRTGPVGQIFTAMRDKVAQHQVAAIGLGSGSLACYSNLCSRMIFYDIDPAVVAIAAGTESGPAYFTYVGDHKDRLRIVLGDARLKIEKADNKQYQLILVDAFSSDAIPIHLITREAVELYFKKLSDDGILAMHISNRHLDLEPVLGNIAQELGLVGLHEYDADAHQVGKTSSDWVVLARKQEDFRNFDEFLVLDETKLGTLQVLAGGTVGLVGSPSGQGPLLAASALAPEQYRIWAPRWTPVRTDPRVGVWTDDFSNLLSVFLW
jgi:spermidine synthase